MTKIDVPIGREVRHSFCRFCHNGCPTLLEVEDGRVVGVTGDRNSPMWEGYTCVKGRAYAEQHYHPERLLQCQKRMPDGSYQPIASEQLLDEVADRLRRLLDRYGPWVLASYMGNTQVVSPLMRPTGDALMDSIGSPLKFDADSLDQIGKHVAKALHGMWMAPARAFEDPDVTLVFGANPLISYLGGTPLGNPGKWLSRWAEKGHQLIVVDPRRTDLAKRAALYIQPRPGEDVALMAGMLRVILTEGLYDKEFVAENVSGVDALAQAVAPFTPDVVARRADIDADDLIRAARTFASARVGRALASTGANMSGPGTLVEYLVLNLNTLCGRWMRAGERVQAPFVATPSPPLKAQAIPPFPGYGLGEPLRATGLTKSMGGYPTAALPDEILDPGEGRIRALFSCGGNPVAAWTDQLKTIEAMKALELLVQIDIKMSATAKYADYVVAAKMAFETPSFTALQEIIQLYAPGYGGLAEPWAQYTEAIVEPPPGSDVLEEWEFFYGIACRLDLDLEIGSILPGMPAPRLVLDREKRPTTEEVLAVLNGGALVSIDELKAYPAGKIFDEFTVLVEPKDPDYEGRLDVGNQQMMSDIGDFFDRQTSGTVIAADGEPLEFRLISRRIQQALNSSGRALSGLRRRYNPAFMNPDDLVRLGLKNGDTVEVRSERGSILGLVEADDTLRPGLVSMTHAFGDVPENDHKFREIGSSVGRLLWTDRDLQPYTGQPLMSNIPVSVKPVAV